MKEKKPLRRGIITLDAPMALLADGDDPSAAEFEREIALTGEYKTRKFALDRRQFEQVIANHKASGVDPAVDLGHESIWNSAAPAVGWVKELSIRPSQMRPGRDALVAKVKLNDLGVREVQNEHFRYLSVGIDLKATNKQTGEPIGAELDHLALVKRPFIEGMTPLSLSADAPNTEENPMKLALKALGLDSEADESQALAAITPLKAFERDVMALSGKQNHAEAIGVLSALKDKAERADKAEADLIALRAAQVKAEIAALIEAAGNDGRVPPAKREQVVALADKIGLDGIKAYLEALPKVALSASEAPVEDKGQGAHAQYTAEEIKVASAFVGNDPAAIAKRIDEIRAVNALHASVAR